jgi:hypothetical protein
MKLYSKNQLFALLHSVLFFAFSWPVFLVFLQYPVKQELKRLKEKISMRLKEIRSSLMKI